MKLGVYGGTFDPPHRAHLAVMLAATRRFALDTLLMVPTGLQPLKAQPPQADFVSRLAMCRLLCAEACALQPANRPCDDQHSSPPFEASALEGPRTPALSPPAMQERSPPPSQAPLPSQPAPNYTVDLLRRLHADHPAGTQFFVIVGADAFLDLRRWREPDALLALAEWIVVSRPGFALDHLEALALAPAQLDRVHLLEDVWTDLSATGIRHGLALGEDAARWLTPPVAAYIHQHHLYAQREPRRSG
jgi:nicotinate-nucleotide adenylyltransferase